MKAEALALHRSNDYDLSQFAFEKTVANTCPSLLALVSQLVSNRNLNKSAVTISQCVQQHISNSTNQTTFGLAVKLHLKFGSSELIKLLNVVMERYTGPKKVNPPLVVYRSGPPFTGVCALQGSLERTQIVDTKWLNAILHDPNPVK